MEKEKNSRSDSFVQYVLDRKKVDKGFRANLRRAANRDTEYQSWGILAGFGVNLERDRERLPFALIGAAICDTDLERDGQHGIGAALASSFENPVDKDKDTPASARMRRLLACSSIREVCATLRPLLRLVNAKTTKPLCHAALLKELLGFESGRGDEIKKRWAMDFYSRQSDGQADTPMES